MKNDKNNQEYIDLVNNVLEALEIIRPFLQKDGGDVEFVDVKSNIAYVRLTGNCATCNMSDSTLKFGIEKTIKHQAPSIKKVVNMSDY